MLEHGADPNKPISVGEVRLRSLHGGCVQTILLLLRHGASPVTYDVYGLAPLHKAAGFERWRCQGTSASRQDIT